MTSTDEKWDAVFVAAIEHGLRASESHDHAIADIVRVCDAVNAAVSSRTSGVITANHSSTLDGPKMVELSLESGTEHRRRLCEIRLSAAGYPMFVDDTPCSDTEEFEAAVAEICRSPSTGLKIFALQRLADVVDPPPKAGPSSR